jgi:hypothetical protein
LDPDEELIQIENLGTGGGKLKAKVNKSGGRKSELSKEAKLLENIVKRLNEEQKFNQL